MLLIARVAVFCVAVIAANVSVGQELPDGPNRNLVYGQCRTCHDLQYLVESAGIPRDAWDDILDSMKQYGLRIPDEQRGKILDYLGTYLGPNPPPETTASAAATTEPPKVDGATVYGELCAACHQPNGQGVAGQFPPLARNADLFASADLPARVVLHGLKGKITVNGQAFDAEMPPLDMLEDAQIAAVVEFIRQSWGNGTLRPKDLANINAAAITRLRKGVPMTADDVHAYRAKVLEDGKRR